jgi:threonine synthase
METLASRGGVLAEPAGAAAFAGLAQALERGLITRDERIVALVTGTAMKNLGHARPTVAATTISADLDAVRHAINVA